MDTSHAGERLSPDVAVVGGAEAAVISRELVIHPQNCPLHDGGGPPIDELIE